MSTPRAVVSALIAALIASLAAFFWAPIRLAALGSGFSPSGQSDIVGALIPAFVAHWTPGATKPSPDLAQIEAYWARFHAIKALIALIALALLIALATVVWRRGKVWLASILTLPALASGVVLLANVQGTFAAASSLQSMLPLEREGALGEVFAGLRSSLRQHENATAHPTNSPELAAMISDFARYHWVFAALCLASALGLTLAMWRWRRGRSALTAPSSDVDHRSVRAARRVLMLGGCLTAGIFALLAFANVTNALNPVKGLLGWLGA